MRGKRWPLMIDPQMQANKWIKNTEAGNGIEVVKATNSNMLRSLENCIRVGRPLLIEDVSERYAELTYSIMLLHFIGSIRHWIPY